MTASATAPHTDIVATLMPRATLSETLANPKITLARAAGTYILFKRKRLTEASERSYRFTLDELDDSRSPVGELCAAVCA